MLALLVEDYEKRTFPMEEPDPVAAKMVRRLFDELHIPMEALIPRHV